MNLFNKGPELKLSEIKVPGFLRDVYYDLKDRHLLPVAVILILATIAVPLALSQSSDPQGSAAGGSGTAGASSASGKSAQLVAKSTPGLRDYRRRLHRLRAVDPFVQQYSEAGTNESGAEESGGTESSSGSSSPSSEFSTPSSPTSPSSQTQAPAEPSPDQLAYYSYAIDVRVLGR